MVVSATVSVEMRIGAGLARVPVRVAFWATAGVALLVSHDAIYAVQVGPGEQLTRILRQAGHDYWNTASVVLAIVGMIALTVVIARLWTLQRRAGGLRRDRVGGARPSMRARLPGTWLRLFALVAIVFVLQENLEHAASHGHLLGLGALFGPDYPLALPVIALVTAAAALLAAALMSTERRLLDVIASTGRPALGRAPRGVIRAPLRLAVARLAPMAGAMAGRAPPSAFVPV